MPARKNKYCPRQFNASVPATQCKKAPVQTGPLIKIMKKIKHIFKKDGVETEVKPERWVWGVIYQDGKELHQFGKDGTFHQIGEVDQDRISMAVLYRYGNMKKRIDLPWSPGMRIIHKYRNFVFDIGTPQERKVKVYIFGYKKGEQYHFNYVLPDDRIIQSPEDNVEITKFGI